MISLDQAKTKHNRRSRPAKTPLSIDLIVDTSLQLLIAGGIEALSLRKVAIQLDTGAASLYVYVDNLEALQELILDKALGKVSLQLKSQKTWRPKLIAILESYFQVLCTTPGLAQLALSVYASGPNSLKFTEAILATLLEGKFSNRDAAWTIDLLLLYTTSIAAEQTQRKYRDDNLNRLQQTIIHVSDTEFPAIFKLQKDLFSGGRARFHWALDAIINGVLRSSMANRFQPKKGS